LPTRADAIRLQEAGFSDLQVKEIAGSAALHAFFNRISTIFALPPQPIEKFPQRWYVRLLRPLFKKYMERLHKTVAVSPLEENEMEGPFSPLIRAMNGLPLARELRIFLDRLLADGALPARSKALLFAVVGRALGCSPSVDEGTRIALAGGLDAKTVEEALDHLASERLNEAENLLLPLARETVWYEPAPIQRRAQEIRDRLAPEQLIEGIVAAAAANMVCRLAAVVVDR
jgi:alkylhydroperoxidase family enzyme